MAAAPSPPLSAHRFRSAVERICDGGQDTRALVRSLADQLRDAVPCDSLLVLRTDPTTVLPVDGMVSAMPPAMCRPFWDNELLEDDYNKFVALARGPVAATLYEATGGDLARSRRYVTLYRRLGVTDELRVSFAARDGSCWGLAQMLRTDGVFTTAERDLVAGAAPTVASALRARFVAPPAAPAAGGPALLVLDAAGEVELVSPEARRWLAELAGQSDTGMAPVPEPVYTVAARARAVRAGRDGGPACAQVRTADSGWLHLHATCLDGPEAASGSVAVVITPAQASDLVPLLALAYRLTHREQQVLGHLARGMTTAEMTRHLGISTHTVRDHVKALLAKVGVRSRAELVARIFAEHYVERLEADVDRTG